MVKRKYMLFGFLVLLPLSFVTTLAQEPGTVSTNTDSITIQTIELESLLNLEIMAQRRKECEASTLPDMVAELAHWDRAMTARREAEQKALQLSNLNVFFLNKSNLVEQANETLQQVEAVQNENPIDHDLAAVRERVKELDLLLVAATSELNVQEDVLKSPMNNASMLQADITATRHGLDDLKIKLSALSSGEGASTLQYAQRQALLARQEMQRNNLALQELLLREHALFNQLHTLMRDHAVARSEKLRKILQNWNSALEQKQKEAADVARDKALQQQSDAADGPDKLRELAAQNVTLNAELQQVYLDDAAVTESLRNTEESLKNLVADAVSIKERYEVYRDVGPNEQIGRMLLRKRAALPRRPTWRYESAQRKKRLSVAANRQLDIAEERRKLADMNAVIELWMSGCNDSRQDNLQLREQLTMLLNTYRKTLDDIYSALSVYITRLAQTQSSETKLQQESQDFEDQLDEWLMYTPTSGVLNPVSAGTDGLKALNRMWQGGLVSAARDLSRDLKRLPEALPVTIVVIFIVNLLVLLLRPLMKRRIRRILPHIGRIRSDSFVYTLETWFYAMLAALGLPLLFTLIGQALRVIPEAAMTTQSLGYGLFCAAIYAGGLNLTRHSIKPQGLAELHFRWGNDTLAFIRKLLRFLLVPGVVLVFMASFTVAGQRAGAGGADGRLAFILLMLLVAFCSHSVLSRQSDLVEELQRRGISHLGMRFRPLWCLLMTCVPIGLAVLSFLGYEYSAMQLSERIFFTLVLLNQLMILRDMLVRWLTMTERRLRYNDALEARAERQREREAVEQAPIAESPESMNIDVPEVDYAQLSEQAIRIIRTAVIFCMLLGVWSIWVDSLPILSFLDDTTFPINVSRIVDGATVVTPLTLADLAVAGVVIFFTFITAFNLPGLLEIILLQRLNLSTGGRYACSTLLRYLVFVVGFGVFFKYLGFSWSNIQWLVAALSVGLGFGLQEIVANFICGLIILFERPVRVGDVVTVGDANGVITRIQMRATTILSWDRQEMIIPNKEFVTGRVLNWTLSDNVVRTNVRVGIAYGSDVDKAMKILQQIAAEHPYVLKDPPCMVHFEAFGDSSLNLVMRFYLPSIEHRFNTVSQINAAIHHRFAENSIEIPFPQRDLHIRSKTSSQVTSSGKL